MSASQQMQASDCETPKQRLIYLITYSQCGDSGLDKEGFAKLVVDAWNELCCSKIIQWVVSEEMHQDGGKHFHMAVKLDKKTRWVVVRNLIDPVSQNQTELLRQTRELLQPLYVRCKRGSRICLV